jgi:hypothetical protein
MVKPRGISKETENEDYELEMIARSVKLLYGKIN